MLNKKYIVSIIICLTILILMLMVKNKRVFDNEGVDFLSYVDQEDYNIEIYDVYNFKFIGGPGQDVEHHNINRLTLETDKWNIIDELNKVKYKVIDNNVDWRDLNAKYSFSIPVGRQDIEVQIREYDEDYLLKISIPNHDTKNLYIIDRNEKLIEYLYKTYKEAGFEY